MGRAPTSGYCHTCRKRRIKCDKGRPTCQRCLKSKYTCGGYELPLRMEHYVPDSGTKNVPRSRPILTPDTRIQLPIQLDLHAFQEPMAFAHFFATYRWAHLWRPVMQVSDGSQPAGKYQGSLAVAYGHLANTYQVPSLKVKSLRLYQTAVRIAQSTISSGSKDELPGLIPVLGVLSQYEYAVEGTSGAMHHYGIQQILKSCGPISFSQEPQLSAFRYARESLLCQSHVQKRALFLETEDWKSLPWSHIPKNAYDQLLDILVAFPSLLERVASQAGSHSSEITGKLNEEVESLRMQLINWRWTWENMNPSSIRQRNNVLGVDNLNLPPKFRKMLSTAIEFEIPSQAAELLTYNAATIELALLRCAVSNEEVHFHTPIKNIDKFLEDRMVSYGRRRAATTGVLLLPNELRFLWQPAFEALRILVFLRKQFSISDAKSFLSLSPIGILYSFFKKFGMQNIVVDIIGHSFDKQQAEKELVHSLDVRLKPSTSKALLYEKEAHGAV